MRVSLIIFSPPVLTCSTWFLSPTVTAVTSFSALTPAVPVVSALATATALSSAATYPLFLRQLQTDAEVVQAALAFPQYYRTQH